MNKHTLLTSLSLFRLIVLLGCILPAIASSQIHLSGEISGVLYDTTYVVDDSVVVNGSLIIRPGAVLLFEENVVFVVNEYGLLRAIGTPGDSIYFLPNEGVTAWRGVHILEWSNTNCEVAWCVFEGSSYAGLGCYDGAQPYVHNCRSSYNSYGIYYCSGFGEGVVSCQITNNINGGLYLNSTASAPVDSCYIANNSGSGIINYATNVDILNCWIHNNSASGDGGGIRTDANGSLYYKCLFTNNSSADDGGGFYSQNRITIDHCVFYNSYAEGSGSAIYTSHFSDISNCIFYGNHGSTVIKLWPSFAEDTYITYNCFFDSADAIFESDNDSLGETTQVNINGDSCDTYYNIFEDPEMVAPDSFDFHLLASSPCIDAGDPDSDPDPDNTTADIGTYYYNQSSVSQSTETLLPQTLVMNPAYPNPFNQTTTVDVLVSSPRSGYLTVYDILGREVLHSSIDLTCGNNRIPVSFERFASGVYFLEVSFRKEFARQKVTFMR